MAGEWKARRAVKVDHEKFVSTVPDVIVSLTKILNKKGVVSLYDLGRLEQEDYIKVVSSIEDSIKEISAIRPTRRIQPVLGSKVLHHYFPSLIPVYDDAMVSKGILRLSSFKKFIDDNKDGWVFKKYKNEPRMKEYHYYLAFSAQQIYETKINTLRCLRGKMKKNFANLSPHCLLKDKSRKNMLSRMDAKISEYCLVGAAKSEKLV